ncbi:uncharacterized protein LOC112089229 [Eutrema salsugineum]|uniref:uncharacterized protein LOC112089229 n=1 Tax=Eutrema salsugineum TaxID=72664 RepID=UPI000CED5B57|nr:uncharacterized protein LOC112089229 [Eutrema salsugineum]
MERRLPLAHKARRKLLVLGLRAREMLIYSSSRAPGKQKRVERSPSEDLSEKELNVASPAAVPQKKKNLEKKPKAIPTYSDYLKKLQAVTLEETWFPNLDFLRKLGIFEEVRAVLHTIGLRNLMEMPHPSYKEITCQFLALLIAEFHNGNGSAELEDGFGSIEFKIGKERYEMTFKEISDCFGFQVNGKTS